MTDTNAFKASVMRKGLTMAILAEKIGVTEATLSYKANNLRQFKMAEAQAIKRILGLTAEERDAIFFADDVEQRSTF